MARGFRLLGSVRRVRSTACSAGTLGGYQECNGTAPADGGGAWPKSDLGQMHLQVLEAYTLRCPWLQDTGEA